MFTTELISIPTGIIFLNGMGTLWRARIRFTVPMLFCLAFFFNFLIGGLSGVFLSDVPSDVTHARQLLRDGPLPLHDHGRPRVRADGRHLLLAAEDDRLQAQRAARQGPLLDDVHVLQPDVLPAVRRRHARACRAASRATTPSLHDAERVRLDRRLLPRAPRCWCSSRTWCGRWSSSASARRATRGTSQSLEWQLPSPVPVHNFERSRRSRADPVRLRHPRCAAGRGLRTARASRARGRAHEPHDPVVADPRTRPLRHANVADRGARLLASAVVFLFMAFVFAFFYLRALNSNGTRSARRTPIRRPAGASRSWSACSAPPPLSNSRAARSRDGTRRPAGALAARLALVLGARRGRRCRRSSTSTCRFGADRRRARERVLRLHAPCSRSSGSARVYWIETIVGAVAARSAGTAGEVGARAGCCGPRADGCALFLVHDGRDRDRRVRPAVPGQVIAAGRSHCIADAGANATGAGGRSRSVLPVGAVFVVLARLVGRAAPPRAHAPEGR